jgi:hypothetical protein
MTTEHDNFWERIALSAAPPLPEQATAASKDLKFERIAQSFASPTHAYILHRPLHILSNRESR